MKRYIWVLVLIVFLAAFPSISFASMAQFTGRWQNVDSDTTGITTLQITQAGATVSVSAWGQCSPTDCAWGTVHAAVYGPNVSTNPLQETKALAATFTTNFNRTFLLIQPDTLGGGVAKIRVDKITTFTDGSNRSPYFASYLLQRDLASPDPLPPTTGIEAPVRVFPLNGAQFNSYPRTMTFDWKPLAGAISYTLEVDALHFCQVNKWCSEVGGTYLLVPAIVATQYTHNFVGAQPGRWRIWAKFAGGVETVKSPWWEFKHLK